MSSYGLLVKNNCWSHTQTSSTTEKDDCGAVLSPVFWQKLTPELLVEVTSRYISPKSCLSDLNQNIINSSEIK